jgi:prepilin-type processing-associated H-X9-DG protein
MNLTLQALQAIAKRNRWWLAEPGRAIIAWPDGHVIATTASFITANTGSNIFALPESRVTAECGAFVCGSHTTSIVAKPGSIIIAHPDCSVYAMHGAIVWAFHGAHITNNGATVIFVDDEADIRLHLGAANPQAAAAAHQFFCAVAGEIHAALNQ